ncbi:tail fiber assembly protein [Pseudomonas sp. ENNP23]|uniref:tail fiber assembly protein n=1 Tax=Pseudomonas sp. ENNP23 TaxID=1535636 RepID=UPI00084AEF5E|nr:tail fiber assembly protein [Pseudomonas sp. ENNP23]OEC52278.1 hypothetical protein A9G05_22240 [Pseudomonas sp. ENNP23]
MKYATFNDDGRVACVYNDETVMIVPSGAYSLTQEQWDQRTALVLVDGEVAICPPPDVSGVYQWNGNKWVINADAQEQATIAQAISWRDALLRSAAMRMAPLQDAMDLGEATADEQEQLRVWKNYRVQLNRIEQQPGFPNSIEWPEPPFKDADQGD